MPHAGRRPGVFVLEGKRISENDTSLPRYVSELGIRDISAGLLRSRLESIGFRKNDIERDDRRAQFVETGDEARYHVAAPGPLANGGEAPLVNVHDRDPATRGARADRVQHTVVEAAVELG